MFHSLAKTVRELPTWKKMVIVSLVIVVPAGILLGTLLFRHWGKSSR
jgi:hypothetical protein